jgi:hypothetical protein
MRTKTGAIAILAASALVVLACGFAISRVQNAGALRAGNARYVGQAQPTMAPVVADYAYRNAIVADLEADVRRHPDQLNSRMLAGEYLQRFREAPDVGDLLRAVASAQVGLRYQPRYNVAAEMTLASAYAGLHKFRIAQRYASDAARVVPWDENARATSASLDLELGRYEEAKELLRASPARADAAWETVAARYAELTGNLAAASNLMKRASVEADANAYEPAENRAWYHWREGELAFEAGDLGAAKADYATALQMFPNYWHATNGLAKVAWAQRRWRAARDEAQLSVAIYPLPETLGYLYDAQQALHEDAAARVTAQLVGAIERIGNSQNINDRLIAAFYSDHGIATTRAVRIAMRDLAVRDDIYAEDTLAWALAMDGRWRDALPHAEGATRLGTQDAKLQFHAGLIELHAGHAAQGITRMRWALSLNSHFHPIYAGVANKIVAQAHDKGQAFVGQSGSATRAP